MDEQYNQKQRTREDMIASLEEQKMILRAFKAAHKDAAKCVSGVVVADKIAESIRDESIVSPLTPELGRQLNESVQRIYNTPNDVDILTTEPIQKFETGKMILISFPGNATSLTNAKGNPVEEKITRSAAQDGIDSFLKFISPETEFDQNQSQCVACYYSHKNNHFVEDYNQRGVPHPGVEKFASLFDNLISKNGQKIDVEDATKNMRGVVMRGQCFGTCVISELEQCLLYKLSSLGYTQEECTKILSAPMALMSSSPVAIEKQPQYFKVFAYANCADTLIPTIEGSSSYQKIAGFTDAEMTSEPCKLKAIQIRQNFRLVVCNHLDLPNVAEMEESVARRLKNPNAEKIHQRVANILKGHAFSAITNPIKNSPFMQQLQRIVRQEMAANVQQVSSIYKLKKLNTSLKNFKAGLSKTSLSVVSQTPLPKTGKENTFEK